MTVRNTLLSALFILLMGWFAGYWYATEHVSIIDKSAAIPVASDVDKARGRPQFAAPSGGRATAVVQATVASDAPLVLPDAARPIAEQRAESLALREHVTTEYRQATNRNDSIEKTIFESESQDGAWAAGIEGRFRDRFAEERPFGDAVIESLDCRVTVCRMVAYNATQNMRQVQESADGRLPAYLLWKMEMHLEQGLLEPSRGFRATVYLGDDFEHGELRDIAERASVSTVELRDAAPAPATRP